MEWTTTLDGKYRIESLSAATFPGALRVIKEDFCKDESVAIGTEINKDEEAAEELLELCASVALDGVSLVAVHVETGEVVAVSFNNIQVATVDPPEASFFDIFAKERCKNPSSRALIQFMSIVDEKCDFFNRMGADCSLEIMFLATLQAHRRLRLGTILCETSIQLAKKLKDGPVSSMTVKDLGSKYAFIPETKPVNMIPKFVQSLFTSELTHRIGKSLGFTIWLQISLNEFSYEGKTYTERIGEERWCEAAALSLED